MQNIKTRRVGRFYLAPSFFAGLDCEEGVNIFHRMVVLRAEQCWDRPHTQYLAIHPDFEEVKPGDVVPVYTATFDRGSIYPRWERME